MHEVKEKTYRNKKLDYNEELIKYLDEYDRFLYKVALSVKNKCRRLEVEDIKQQIILVILTNYNKFDENKDNLIEEDSILGEQDVTDN